MLDFPEKLAQVLVEVRTKDYSRTRTEMRSKKCLKVPNHRKLGLRAARRVLYLDSTQFVNGEIVHSDRERTRENGSTT